MYRFATHRKPWHFAVVTGVLLLLSTIAAAADADGTAPPITIIADSAELSRPDNVSTYTGDVVLTRGGLTLTGNQLTISRLQDDAYRADLTGTPATLKRVSQSQSKPLINGHGDRIIYLSQTAQVTLRGNAVIKRDGDVIHSDIIHHDLDTRKTVAGGSTTNDGRVKITLHPDDDSSAAKP